MMISVSPPRPGGSRTLPFGAVALQVAIAAQISLWRCADRSSESREESAGRCVADGVRDAGYWLTVGE